MRLEALTPEGAEAACGLQGASLKIQQIVATAASVRVVVSFREGLSGCGFDLAAVGPGDQVGVLTLTHDLQPVSWLKVASAWCCEATLRVDPWMRVALLQRRRPVLLDWPVALASDPEVWPVPGDQVEPASMLLLFPDGTVADIQAAGQASATGDFACEPPSAGPSRCKLVGETSSLGTTVRVRGEVVAETAGDQGFVLDFAVPPLPGAAAGAP